MRVVERRIGDGLSPEQAARITERLGVVRSTSPLDDGSDDLADAVLGDGAKVDAEEARRRRERARNAARRVVEIRRDSLHAAQRSLAAARYRKGVDPEAISEKMHEIDRRLLSLPKDHHE